MTDIRFDDRWSGRPSGVGHGPASGSGGDTCKAEPAACGDDVLVTVALAVQREVVPRLLMATKGRAEDRPVQAPPVSISAADVDEFTRLVMASDRRAPAAFVDAFRERGMPVSDILLDLLAPAARLLGDMWLRDSCSFSDVSMGLIRLHQIMRGITVPSRRVDPSDGRQRSILLLHFPREQHRFGLSLVQEVFHNAGWRVTMAAPASVEEVADAVRDEWFDVIGISLANDGLLNDLTSAISTWRRCSRNETLAVLVGGAAFNDHPERSDHVGADGSTPNAGEAVRLAENLVGVGVRSPTGN